MSAPFPQAVYPWPISPEREALIRQAKASLNSPQKIELVPAAYGSPGRVLAFETPTFLCSYAPIRPENADKVQSIAAALRYILDETEPARPDSQWSDEALLSSWFKAPVKFSHFEERDGKVVFHV